ncbi:hypothetical protein [Calothrix sp. NIES-3974]|uniref:hypothetical protein n=1 Tax=Calothrix sp. NIES-3974 TaxID=2005462 RepID=UPI000B61027D|nr:hypothetical protein [Calothrix sp. NIES-3974]BAZ07950.1 hypothetical protein NIES3974_46180 [Calothrix sp. NIES-3974]
MWSSTVFASRTLPSIFTMMRSLDKQQPLPTPGKHREPPSLWLFAIAVSTGLHSLLLWFLFESQFTLITKQADNSFTPIEIIEIPPSPQTSPDKPKPAPQTKLPPETTTPETNTNPDTDGEIELRKLNDAIALQQKQQLEQQRQQQLAQQRQRELEQQRQRELEQQRQQQIAQQQRQRELEQQRQQQLAQQRQQQLEQQQQRELEQQRQQQLAQQRQQQLEQQQQRELEEKRRAEEATRNLEEIKRGGIVDVDKDPIKPTPGDSGNVGGLVAINISVFSKPEQDQRVKRDLPHIYARPQGNLPNTLPMVDGYAIAQRVECEVLLIIDDKGKITSILADLSNPQRNLCQKYSEAFFENATFEPAQDESGNKPPLSQLYVKIVIEPNPPN